MKIVQLSALIVASGAIVALTAVGCGSAPPPTARLASSEAAIRSARELGAQDDPQASLHLKLADEQLATARTLMHDNDNKRADMVLQRASSDAELAIMLTREKNAKIQSDKSRANLNSGNPVPMAPNPNTTSVSPPNN